MVNLESKVQTVIWICFSVAGEHLLETAIVPVTCFRLGFCVQTMLGGATQSWIIAIALDTG